MKAIRENKSDVVDSRAKSTLARRVQAESTVMRNAKYVYEDCLKVLELHDTDGKMKMRKFILVNLVTGKDN